MWNFGSLALVFLTVQLITGLCLSLWYIPDIDWAFFSVDYTMKDAVNGYGWVIQYGHVHGASFLFLMSYVHMARFLFYSSYQQPRIFVWWSGLSIYFLLILTAFVGSFLPWGQMIFWLVTVIKSLATVVSFLGNCSFMLIWGDFGSGQQIFIRFYSFHFFFPFVILFLVAFHFFFLHIKGSSDPLKEIRLGLDKVSFHSCYTYKDLVGVLLFLLFYFLFIFFYSNILGYGLNYIQSNSGVMPVLIVSEWYLLPFYGILRAIPSKIFGVLLLLVSLLLLAVLPVFHDVNVKHSIYRPMYKGLVLFFVCNFVMLGWLGYEYNYYSVLDDRVTFKILILLRVFCVFYIMFFLLLSVISTCEKLFLFFRDAPVTNWIDPVDWMLASGVQPLILNHLSLLVDIENENKRLRSRIEKQERKRQEKENRKEENRLYIERWNRLSDERIVAEMRKKAVYKHEKMLYSRLVEQRQKLLSQDQNSATIKKKLEQLDLEIQNLESSLEQKKAKQKS